MSRWANDPDRAADELIVRCLSAIDLQGNVLLACHRAEGLRSVIADRGLGHCSWHRRLSRGGQAQPWPTGGPYDAVFLRLPKAKAEQEMAAHACLSVAAPEGQLFVYGGNEEGIRSFTGTLAQLCGHVETLATRGHGRVLAGRRPGDVARLKSSLTAWRSVARIQLGGLARDWTSYPGIFAADRIDEGTALLIGVLPPLPPGARVLDYGCGSGVIGASALAQEPSLVLDLLDADSVALEAARENVPGACILLGDSLADAAGAGRYDAILSNPPLHEGFVEDHSLLEQLIADAPDRLAPGGMLQLVVQRRVPLDRMLARHFEDVAVVAGNGRYRVWQARRAQYAPLLRPTNDRSPQVAAD